ncbi:Pentatricopeptide repeat-containing protein [Acorus calamus]|uniref:Pentatricopeptide repeat-containing protein n=1 Tax=Acorus calamus TaxID=4465 RepID=A0AAV9ELD4_ACOCL|nr:Pentatricopeptide repeat-containing protein [Acorus calamus]
MELQQETIPLQNGYRFYNILGLKASKWYEVKISYPASIPSSFSIQLKSDPSDFGLNKNRRLLNTEKLIFNVKNHNWTSGDSKLYALVTVEPEGIVGKLHVQERELVIFNIAIVEPPSLDLGVFMCDQWMMVRPPPPLSIHYCTLLRRSAILTLPSDVQKLHSILTKTGRLHSLRTALLHAYAACPSSSSSALRLFSEIPLPLTETPDWTALISSCARDGLPQQSLRLFRAMESLPDAPRPDQVTAVSVFVACSQLSDSVTGARAHLAFIKRGLPFTIPPATPPWTCMSSAAD